MLKSILATIALALPLALLGCGDGGDAAQTVTLYTSVDEPYAKPIIEAFEAKTGIQVNLVTDTEATKSVGLAERLRAESAKPRANVWWGNEPFYTVRLAEDGLLASYEAESATEVPAMYRDPQDRWIGNGLRARGLVTKTDDNASSLDDFATRGGFVARPTAGTTGGHVAALYAVLGQDEADAMFKRWHDAGVVLVGGNSQVVQEVSGSDAGIGLTDNDDVSNAISRGMDVRFALINQDALGTLTIPTTIALVAGSEANDAAKQLVDYLASAEVEEMMTASGFVAYSVRDEETIKAMNVDYAEVAAAMPESIRRATAILEGREP